MFWAGHVEIYFETVNLNNTHIWLRDRMRTAELKFPRVFIRLFILSDANWITCQETCAVKNCSGMWAAVWQDAWLPGNWSLLATNCIQKLARSQSWKEQTHFPILVTEYLNLSFPKSNHVILQHKLSSLRGSWQWMHLSVCHCSSWIRKHKHITAWIFTAFKIQEKKRKKKKK